MKKLMALALSLLFSTVVFAHGNGDYSSRAQNGNGFQHPMNGYNSQFAYGSGMMRGYNHQGYYGHGMMNGYNNRNGYGPGMMNHYNGQGAYGPGMMNGYYNGNGTNTPEPPQDK